MPHSSYSASAPEDSVTHPQPLLKVEENQCPVAHLFRDARDPFPSETFPSDDDIHGIPRNWSPEFDQRASSLDLGTPCHENNNLRTPGSETAGYQWNDEIRKMSGGAYDPYSNEPAALHSIAAHVTESSPRGTHMNQACPGNLDIWNNQQQKAHAQSPPNDIFKRPTGISNHVFNRHPAPGYPVILSSSPAHSYTSSRSGSHTVSENSDMDEDNDIGMMDTSFATIRPQRAGHRRDSTSFPTSATDSLSPKTAVRPFVRNSKAGHVHTVVPASASMSFTCPYPMGPSGRLCGETFQLPHKIRGHLVDVHMKFSPFQCHYCKKVYTRQALRTRHLKHDSTSSFSSNRDSANISLPTEPRRCPNEQKEPDQAFHHRQEMEALLQEIKTEQSDVDMAVRMILRLNDVLEERKTRPGSMGGGAQGGRRLSDGQRLKEVLDDDYDPSGASPPGYSGTSSSSNSIYRVHSPVRTAELGYYHNHQQMQQQIQQQPHYEPLPALDGGAHGFPMLPLPVTDPTLILFPGLQQQQGQSGTYRHYEEGRMEE